MSAIRETLRMTSEEVRDFLAKEWWLTLSTIGPGGVPHLVTIGYGLLDGRLMMSSYAKAQKVVNLRRDPRAGCLVERGMDTYAAIRGVRLVGRAVVHDDPDLALAVARTVLVHKAAAMGDAGEVPRAPEELGAKRVAIELQVERSMSWDHRHLAGRY